MKSRNILILLALLLLVPSAAFGQFWEKKEWNSWSKEDTRKMLEDSPWSKTWSHGENRRSEVGESSQGTARETEPRIYYAIQLRSALPVRQGVARQLQLGNNYDKMPADKKSQLDQSIEGYLNKSYGDVIVVHVVFWSNVTVYERRLLRTWQSLPEGTIPVNARLTTSRGKVVEPIRFVPPPGGTQEFELIFPRLVNGEPIISAGDKSFRIEFPSPDPGFGSDTNQGVDLLIASAGAGGRVTAEFKLDKMAFKGTLHY